MSKVCIPRLPIEIAAPRELYETPYQKPTLGPPSYPKYQSPCFPRTAVLLLAYSCNGTVQYSSETNLLQESNGIVREAYTGFQVGLTGL